MPLSSTSGHAAIVSTAKAAVEGLTKGMARDLGADNIRVNCIIPGWVNKFGDKVFDTIIPRNVRLAEAPSYGQPGVVFDPASKGAQAFVDFAREMAGRLG